MKKTLLLLLISILWVQSVLAVELDYEHGHFKNIKYSSTPPMNGVPYKLKDGRVLILDEFMGGIKIFDPKTSSFVLSNCLGRGAYRTVTLLNDETLLVTGVAVRYPAFRYTRDIEKLLEKEGIKYPYQHIRGWDNLSFAEREQLYLSYIQQNPELNESYKAYVKDYEDSMYAQIYNIHNLKTNVYKHTGKLNLRRGNVGHVLLNDGTVLFFGGKSYEHSVYAEEQRKKGKDCFDLASQFEVYNPKTGEFKFLDTHASLGYINKAFLLNDGRVFIVSSKENANYNEPQRQTQEFSIYNPSTGELFRSKHKFNGIALVKLPDDRILYTNRLDGLVEEKHYELVSGLRIYDPKTDKVVYSGKSHFPRSYGSQLTVLPDGNVMVSGGINRARSSDIWSYEKRVEIFNPTTGEVKLIRPRMRGGARYDSVLLDDGRILFYSNYDAELYIPKGYVEK